MALDRTSTELLATIRQRSFTSAASRDFTDTDLLRLLNENITYVMRLIARRNTNYLVEHVDVTVSSGVPNYLIPSVAMAGALRAVTLLVGGVPYALTEMSLSQAVATNLTPLSTQFPIGYYFEGPNVVLFPTQSIGGILRLHYHRRPSQVVLPAASVKITGFPGGAAGGFYRISYAGTAPAGYTTGALVDVISNSPNYTRWQTSVALGTGAANALDIPVPQPTNLAVGDWVSLADTAPLLTDAPEEVVDAWCEATAADMMKAKGSNDSYARMLDGVRRKEEDCGPLIQQRNTGAMRKISAFPDVSGWPWAGW